MRKLAGFLAAMLLLVPFVPRAAAVSAKSAIAIDGTTGQVLFEQNADERLPMASTTKIMTAITAIEHFDLDRTYTVKPEYTRVEGSSMYLKAGERITLRETLYGLMLMSGNDAALAVAGECGGQTHFVALMNDTAARLGLKSTHFDNPNGLDGETHYTTARELAALAAYAMRNAAFRDIVSTKSHTEKSHTDGNVRYMKNHNKLLSLYDGAVGVKTGFTKKSGRCLVSAAERNGRRIIAVTLHAPDDWNDHIAMLDAGFAQYAPCTLHQAGAVLCEQPVEGGNVARLPLAADEDVTAWLLPGERAQIRTAFYGARFNYAPVAAGSSWGTVTYKLHDETLATGKLHFLQGAALLPEEKSATQRFWERVRAILPWEN